MKKISHKVSRSATGGPRKARSKLDKVKNLNITSLVDILTILLVFMIKNVSMDASRLDVPENMKLPTTITVEELEKSGLPVVLKVFTNQILIGNDNIPVGSPEEFMSDQTVRSNLLKFMNDMSHQVSRQDPNLRPVLLVQADINVKCLYITDIVSLSASSGFSGIYFSTVKGDDADIVYGL